MKKRTKLSDRALPDYTRGEERMNMITHIVGGALGFVALVMCVARAAVHRSAWAVVASVIYGSSMIALYTVSSVYHGLRPGMGKKVMQVIDHCTIYFLIAGCYTPVVLCSLRPVYPALAWGMLVFEWVLGALAVVLTAIDLDKYEIFSMCCYIGMGWAAIPAARQIIEVMTWSGFLYLLLGGIAYTIGAVLYGIGAKMRWMHSIFHIFVVLGSLLQLIAVFGYVI